MICAQLKENTITSIAYTSIPEKIKDEKVITIFLTLAITVIDAPRLKIVTLLTIMWKGCTISRDIRQDSAQLSQRGFIIVTMENFVPLHIRFLILELGLFIQWQKMLTSIFSTTRLNGVPITKNTTRHFVIMLIIGKILEEIHCYSTMIKMKCVLIGRLVPLLLNMKRDVIIRLHAKSPMDGKKKNIIH